MVTEKDIQTLFLCKPCAEEMKEYKTVKGLRYDRPARSKGTCALCGRRRFGYICEVNFREPEEIIPDE